MTSNKKIEKLGHKSLRAGKSSGDGEKMAGKKKKKNPNEKI